MFHHSFVETLTCSTVVSLGELDLDFVLPGDVLNAAAFGPHDGAVVALGDGHLHGHLRFLRKGKTVSLRLTLQDYQGFNPPSSIVTW